jgi:hypothetical protein
MPAHSRGDEATDADGEQADRAEEEGREDQLTHRSRAARRSRLGCDAILRVAEPRDRLLR